MFASDRDLLIIEPQVFRDIAWLGQRVMAATGDVAGTSLTISGASFADAGVEAGCVVLIAGRACEVVSIESATEATVSLARAIRTGAPLPPPAATGAAVEVWSFRPQIGVVHEQLMRVLELGEEGQPGAAEVMNPESLALLEALGALHVLYAAAGALSPAGSALVARASMYRAWFGAERQRAVVRLDLDGDGKADATRRLLSVPAMRA